MASYRYVPLPVINAQFPVPLTRLLLLHSGHPGDPLTCTISIENAESAPPYEALSYVWGHETASSPILCNEMPIQITANLESALQSIRFTSMSRRLWIDAICINQSSTDERSRQVGYMHLIYAHATRVIAWLGPLTPGVGEAFDFIERLSNIQRAAPGNRLTTDNYNVTTLYPDLASDQLREDASMKAIRGLFGAFDLEYFRRSWCIQEVVTAQSCIARCGDLEIDFYHFADGASLAESTSNPISASPTMFFWSSLKGRHENHRVEHTHRLVTPDANWRLSLLLLLSRQFLATDPRDKVYSLLGMAAEGLAPITVLKRLSKRKESRLVSKFRHSSNLFSQTFDLMSPNIEIDRLPALRPDYSKDVVELYTEVTILLIRTPPFVLDVLSHVHHSSDPTGHPFPSWVPLWFEQPAAKCLGFPAASSAGQNGAHGPYRAMHPHVDWRSTQALATWAIIHDRLHASAKLQPNTLILEGYLLDEIDAVSGVIDYGGSDVLYQDKMAYREFVNYVESFDVPYREIWRQLLGTPFQFPAFGKQPGDGSTLQESFLATLIACGIQGAANVYEPSAKDAARCHPDTPQGQMQRWRRLARMDVAAFLWTEYPNARPAVAPWEEPGAEPGIVQRFRKAARIAHDRRVFRTRRHGWLGLGPKVAREGDRVVVLLGGSVPYVLRAQGEHHFFLGDAYVHDDDIMGGEMTDRVTEGRSDVRVQKYVLI